MGTPRARFSGSRAEDVSLLPYALSARLHVSGSTTLSVAPSSYAKCLLTNPVGSGKTLVVLELHYFSDATLFMEFWGNPTTGLPTTARGITLIGGVYSGVTTFKSDTDSTPMGGGIKSDITFGSGTGNETVGRVPFMVTPGVSLGFSALAVGARTMYLNPVWIEV